MTYAAWIEKHVKGDGYGKCVEVVKAMGVAFPELSVRFGFYFCAWGRREHWWLRCGDRIIDPTGRQHPGGSLFPESDIGYEDLTNLDADELANKVPTGVCMNCGDPVYRGDTFCDDSCEAATIKYLNGI